MMIKEMSIDLETYSDVDIKKSGAYRYVESPEFEILLFAVSINGNPVVVYDMASRDVLPENILQALVDDSVTKWAFNAAFERICLSEYLRREFPELMKSQYLCPDSWKCSMIWSAYMGLPLSLEGAGSVLGLEEQKLKEGKDLIRYFCVPCKPTKTNGGRTRNLPVHSPEKWELFKAYNKRDVEVEMSIQKKLQKFPVSDFVWEEYHMDQCINDRGIGLLDVFAIVLIVLPLYPNVVDGFVYSVNLFAYIQTTSLNRSLYWIMIVFLVVIGFIKLILIKLDIQRYNKVATNVSMSISTLSVLLFAITRESYAVAVVFLLLVMKGILLLKCAKV